MFVDWLETQIRKIEKASFSVEETLARDNPERADKTSYNRPREEYLACCLNHVRQACRSVVLTCRLIRTHFDGPSSELLKIDLLTLYHDQQKWHRKLSEIFCNIVNLDIQGEDYFSLFLLRDKAEGRRKRADEMNKLFGSKNRLLEVYCCNDETAFQKLRGALPNSNIASWTAETSIEKALEHATDAEKSVVGFYLHYRLRSGSIHFSTFPKDDWNVDIDLLLFGLSITTLLGQFIVVRAARMFPLILQEVAELSATEIKKIFEDNFKNLISPNVSIGDRVEVLYNTTIEVGIVEETREGKLGGKSYRVRPLDGMPPWCHPNDFHPAMFVSKVACQTVGRISEL